MKKWSEDGEGRGGEGQEWVFGVCKAHKFRGLF
jgi:hypothetical protein